MRGAAFNDWLNRRFPRSVHTVQSRLSTALRVEAKFGDLDSHFARDGLATVLSQLEYSSDDKSKNRPNPSPVTIDGDLYTGLASLRQAVRRYQDFSVEQRSKREG